MDVSSYKPIAFVSLGLVALTFILALTVFAAAGVFVVSMLKELKGVNNRKSSISH